MLDEGTAIPLKRRMAVRGDRIVDGSGGAAESVFNGRRRPDDCYPEIVCRSFWR
ncbi:MAG: hypothetical protein OXU79_03805 [Gemmatimonadota bacterium]|nr:hypothetical protein [Gemmatimonadota bacterium]